MINTCGHVNWLQEGSKLFLGKRALLIEKLPNKAVNQIKMPDNILRTLRTSANKRQLVKFIQSPHLPPTPPLPPTIKSKNGWTDSDF